MAAQHSHPLAAAPLSAAMVPQHLCMQDSQMGAHQWCPCCQALAQRSTGRALPAWRTYRRLDGDELLLLSSFNPKSFDSRHFGTVSVDGIIVRMQLL